MSSRRRQIALAALLALACILWLVATRDPSPDVRRWFGLWRTRHVLVSLALAWATIAVLLRSVSLRALARGLLATFSVALCWLLLEVAGIVGVVSYPRVFGQDHGEPLGSQPLPNAHVRGQTTGDIAAGWGVAAEPVDFDFRTDRRGFRNAEDREAADVYLLGDSILVAGLLPFEDTVTARLEKDLGRPVMSIALIGLSPQAERDLFRRAQVPVRGRLVLQLIFEDNDLVDSETFRRRQTGAPEPSRVSLADRSLSHNLELWILSHTQPIHPVAARFTGEIGGRPYYFAYARSAMRGHDGELPFIGAALAELRDEVVRQGGRYGVVLVPSKLRVLGPLCRWPPGSELGDYASQLSPLPGFLGQWSREVGVPFLDATEFFAARAASGEVPFFAADTHPNAAGHAALEQALSQWSALRDWLAAPSSVRSVRGD